MKAAKATIEALLNATEDSCILIDPEGRFVALNKEAARRRGSSVEALIGKNVFDFLDPAIAGQRRACVAEVVRTGRPLCAHEEINNRHYRVSFYPVIDESGAVTGVASYSRDCTEAREHEEELLRAKEMAESASMAKSQFLSNMSHELRTPLNGILGISQLALDETLDLETRNNFEMIQESGQRLLILLNNLLDLAAIERRSIEPLVRDFDLFELLESLRKSFALKANLHRVDLEIHMSAKMPRCWSGDEFRLGQILSNLIANALQCTEDGYVRVAVGPGSACSDRADNRASWQDLRFVVKDSGPGIDEKDIGSLFDSFTIAENFMTKRYSGAGIGLSIVRALVEMLGGSIRVRSGKGQGTAISFTIPFIPAGAPCADPGQISVLPLSGPEARRTILVVEDDPIALFATTRSLTRVGFDVREAANGAEALDLLRHHAVNLVLMDLHMPVMDGLQTTIHIRNGEVPGVSRNIPIIAMTSHAGQRNRDRLARAGVTDTMIKPVCAAQIDKVLVPHLQRH
ncbi:PAS domain-containing sensor histidine kinase [Pseudodesulfovibrio alkaliphilus]|nr:PAS domain-containing sensor histidine kinase [Pseudodesulfovibrio alkaliphilus]